jgi:hypothetical protein
MIGDEAWQSTTKLSDLRGLCLYIMCENMGCRRILARPVEEFIDKVGDIEIEKLQPRLRCDGCGRRAPSVSPWTGGPFPALHDRPPPAPTRS